MRSRTCLLLVAAAVVPLLVASPASAHSVLVSSTPQDGQVLATAPTTLDLGFSEAVDASATRVQLVDASGRRLLVSGIHSSRGNHVVARFPALPDQTYRLVWQTVAADDRHETSGLIVFRVGAGAAPSVSVPQDRLPNPLEAGLHWLLLMLSGGLVGALVLAGLMSRSARRRRFPAEVRSLVLSIGLASGVLAALVAPLLTVDQVGGAGRLLPLLTSAFGLRSAVVEAALLVLTGVAGYGRRRRVGRVVSTAAGVALVALAFASALLAHAATSIPRTMLEASHLLAAYLWFGVVLLVPVAALAAARQLALAAALRAELPSLLLAFGSLAMGSVGWLIVSGLLLTGDSVSTVDALLFSVFGRLLMIKIGLAFAAGLLGLRMHRRLRSYDPRVNERALAAEALVLVATLGCIGALVASAPAQGLRWQPGTTLAGSSEVAGEQDGLVESVTVSPNLAGRNFVEVRVFNSRRPAPAPVSAVGLTILGPAGESLKTAAHQSPDGGWAAPLDVIDRAGPWLVTLVVERRGSAPVTTRYTWTVAGRIGGPARAVVSTARVAPIAGVLAAGAGVVGLGGLMLVVRRRRRAPPTNRANLEPAYLRHALR